MLQLKHIALHTGVLTPPPKKKKELYIYAGEWINWAFVNWELEL